SLDGQLRRGLYGHVGGGLDLDGFGSDGQRAGGRLDLHVTPARLDGDLVVGRVPGQRVGAALVADDDLFAAAGVVELDDVAGARLDEADVVLFVVAVARRRRVDLAPERAENVGTARIAVLERHQHFVAHLRLVEEPAVLAGHRRDDSRPVGQLLGDPRRAYV